MMSVQDVSDVDLDVSANCERPTGHAEHIMWRELAWTELTKGENCV